MPSRAAALYGVFRFTPRRRAHSSPVSPRSRAIRNSVFQSILRRPDRSGRSVIPSRLAASHTVPLLLLSRAAISGAVSPVSMAQRSSVSQSMPLSLAVSSFTAFSAATAATPGARRPRRGAGEAARGRDGEATRLPARRAARIRRAVEGGSGGQLRPVRALRRRGASARALAGDLAWLKPGSS